MQIHTFWQSFHTGINKFVICKRQIINLTPMFSNYLDISSAVDSLSICKICFCSLLLYRDWYRLQNCLIWLLCILYNVAWEQAWNKINIHNEKTFKRLCLPSTLTQVLNSKYSTWNLWCVKLCYSKFSEICFFHLLIIVYQIFNPKSMFFPPPFLRWGVGVWYK